MKPQRYVKRDGSVSLYYKGSADIRGPQLVGRAPRRTKPQQVRLYLLDVSRGLRDARLAAGISVDELAAASGVNSSTIFYIERERQVPSLKTLVAIAHALARSPAELLP